MMWRPQILCSICDHSFEALKKDVRLFIASLHNQPIYPKMCYIDIFVNLQPVGWNLKGGLFDPRFGLNGDAGSGISPLDSPAMDCYSMPIDTWHLLPFWVIWLDPKAFSSTCRPASPTWIQWQLPFYKLQLRRSAKNGRNWEGTATKIQDTVETMST